VCVARRSFGARLGSRIRARREALGISQAALAERVGVFANYVGVLERGLKLPTLDTLVKIGTALRVSAGEILGERAVKDDWIDEVVAVAATVPKTMRPTALAVLRAVATTRS